MNYDFALVTLAQDATSGYLGLHLPPGNGATESATLNTAGYPGSKPSGTMWSSACGSTRIDYSTNNEFANVQQCANGVRLPLKGSSTHCLRCCIMPSLESPATAVCGL